MGSATFALNHSSFPQLFYFFHVLLFGKETVVKILSDRLMVRWCTFGNAVFTGYSERHKCLTFPTSSPSWPNSHFYGSLCFSACFHFKWGKREWASFPSILCCVLGCHILHTCSLEFCYHTGVGLQPNWPLSQKQCWGPWFLPCCVGVGRWTYLHNLKKLEGILEGTMAYAVKTQSILVRFKHFWSLISFIFLQQIIHITLFHFPLIAPLKQVLKGCRIGRCLHSKYFFHITLGGITGLISLKGIVPHHVWKEITTKNRGNVKIFFKKLICHFPHWLWTE